MNQNKTKYKITDPKGKTHLVNSYIDFGKPIRFESLRLLQSVIWAAEILLRRLLY